MKDIYEKIERMRAGEPPRVLDLFSGCGGISLGLKMAGATPVAGLDNDRGSMENWFYNLRPDLVCQFKYIPAWDISKTDPQLVFNNLGIPEMVDQIDIVCGGPPCQAYSRVGRGKLRSLSGTDAHLTDDRGSLYQEFLRYVGVIRPVAVICENVSDSTNYGGENIPDEICKELTRIGYNSIWTLLNAAEFGVPQYRQRVFILAIHKAADIWPIPPMLSHRIVRPQNSRITRDLADTISGKTFDREKGNYVRCLVGSENLPAAINTEEALDDLPVITPLTVKIKKKIFQDVKVLMPYSSALPECHYQHIMRSWPGFETNGWVTGNTIRVTPRDFPIFAKMEEGYLYPDALRIANELLVDKIAATEKRLNRPLSGSEKDQLKKTTVPPYDEKKFEGKWTKLRRDQPAHTIVAHLQYDTYSHIHYDSSQARAITVREAARLQSFPDGFRFFGSMKSSFQQIGNAVPPLVAMAIGKKIINLISGKQFSEMNDESLPA